MPALGDTPCVRVLSACWHRHIFGAFQAPWAKMANMGTVAIEVPYRPYKIIDITVHMSINVGAYRPDMELFDQLRAACKP